MLEHAAEYGLTERLVTADIDGVRKRSRGFVFRPIAIAEPEEEPFVTPDTFDAIADSAARAADEVARLRGELELLDAQRDALARRDLPGALEHQRERQALTRASERWGSADVVRRAA